MRTRPHVLVVYYSATGRIFRTAQAVASGAATARTEVRVRRVPVQGPPAASGSNPAGGRPATGNGPVPHVTVDDVRWADGVALGTPMKMAMRSPQLAQFIDMMGGGWVRSELEGKVYGAFTATGPDGAGVYASTLTGADPASDDCRVSTALAGPRCEDDRDGVVVPLVSAEHIGRHVARAADVAASARAAGHALPDTRTA